jgi:hypothetical protein
MKIAICFYGIIRSLNLTYPSIRENIVIPARELGDVRIFTHLFEKRYIKNKHSEEDGETDFNEHSKLESDHITIEKPQDCLNIYPMGAIKEFGDAFDDGYQSLENLIHQLHSLKIVTNDALEWGADIVLFCRPDLEYHDSIKKYVKAAVKSDNKSYILIPDFVNRPDRLNDRFSLCVGRDAISSFGLRVNNIIEFCESKCEPLHSEKFLAYVLEREGIPVKFMRVRATRVRVNGSKFNENFESYKTFKRKKLIKKIKRRIKKLLGVPQS